MSISPSESKGTTVNFPSRFHTQNPNFPNHGDINHNQQQKHIPLSISPSRRTAGASERISDGTGESAGKLSGDVKVNSQSTLTCQSTGNINVAVQIPKGAGSTRYRGKPEATASRSPQKLSPGNLNPAFTNARGKRMQIANGNHLLNFQYDPIVRPQPRAPPPRRTVQKVRPYNKDLFLQANFKFVVLDTGNYTPDVTDPDKMLQWEDVVCVKYCTPFPVNCPICLEEPLCPQITSCGHIFCFPCILQYLLMGKEDEHGESWKRCPLCFVMISPRDLYTIYIENVKQYLVGDTIEFMLLTREKNSLSICAKNKSEADGAELNDDGGHDFYSKFSFTSDVDLSVRQAISDLDSWLVGAESGLVEDIEKLPYVCASMAQLEQRKKYWESHQGLNHRKPFKGSGLQVESLVSKMNLSASYPNTDEGNPQQTDSNTNEQSTIRTTQAEDVVPSDTCDPVLSSISINNGDKKLSDARDDNAYTFYQAVDGQLLILHPLNMRCLLHHYGSSVMLPNRISGRILQMETVTQTEAMRRRYRYLSHFSLTTTFQLCEIDLSNIIPPVSLAPFMDEIRKRENQRKRIAKKEQKEKVKADIAITEYYLPVQSSFTSSSYDEPPFSLDDFEALGSSSAISTSPPQVGAKILFSSVTKLGYAAGAGSELPVSTRQSSEATSSGNSSVISFANMISRDRSTDVLASPNVNDKGKKGKKANRVLLSTAGGRRY